MLKKLLLASLVCGLCFGGEAIDFNGNVSDELVLHALANNNIIEDNIAGAWYLYHFDDSKYYKVKDDEFERADAYKQAKEALEKLKEQHKNLDTNKIYSMLSIAEFDEYDFEKEEFPVKFITKDSFYNLSKGKIARALSGSDQGILVFDNVNTDKHILKMAKDEAKEFLKAKKSPGYIDRVIDIDIEFSLSKVEFSENSKQIEEDYLCPEIVVTGHIKKLTLLDRKVKDPKSKKPKVLSVVEYE